MVIFTRSLKKYSLLFLFGIQVLENNLKSVLKKTESTETLNTRQLDK